MGDCSKRPKNENPTFWGSRKFSQAFSGATDGGASTICPFRNNVRQCNGCPSLTDMNDVNVRFYKSKETKEGSQGTACFSRSGKDTCCIDLSHEGTRKEDDMYNSVNGQPISDYFDLKKFGVDDDNEPNFFIKKDGSMMGVLWVNPNNSKEECRFTNYTSGSQQESEFHIGVI